MEEDIQGFIYDLGKPVKLLNPKNKYWTATLIGKKLIIEVGKVKAGVDEQEESIDKDYVNDAQAKSSMVSKIKDKLVKGYYSSVPLQEIKPASTLKRRARSPPKQTSGEYLERAGESTMFEISDKRVRVTRTGKDNKQKVEVQNFNSNDQAIQFFESQQQWLINQGYKANSSKFVYSFLPDSSPDKSNYKAPKSVANKNNGLSIIAMTDDAISRSSKNNSASKSNRSQTEDDDDDDQTSFQPSQLGPHCSNPIDVLLAETWNDSYDPTGYYLSQKLDGVRCFWTGTKMYSRQGNQFFPPKWFVKGWPKSQMDGQLFIGRDMFKETISAIKKKVPIDSQWQQVVYLVFDAPGLKKPFNKRVQIMQKIITKIDNKHLKCHAHRICTGYDDLLAELDAVNKIKGQGLMLRQPNSPYENRRSKNLLKVKTFHDDEATILGFQPGSGRCTGMVGAFNCRNTHGVEFDIGSGLTDAMRKKPPKIGTKITYKYQQFIKGSGKPRFPIFLRIYEPL